MLRMAGAAIDDAFGRRDPPELARRYVYVSRRPS